MPVYQVQNGSWARKHDMPERVLPRDAGEHDAARVRQCGCVVLSITLTAGIVLQVVFVALLVGFGIQALGEHGEPLIVGIGHLQRLVFKILAMVMWVAPIGAFGAMAAVVGETGSDALRALAMILLAFYATCLLFVVGVLGTILRLVTGLSPGSTAGRVRAVAGRRDPRQSDGVAHQGRLTPAHRSAPE
ncbi:MAG: cation:dicarboxylase symporter family transporter [Nocardioidaceae bacterium]